VESAGFRLLGASNCANMRASELERRFLRGVKGHVWFSAASSVRQPRARPAKLCVCVCVFVTGLIHHSTTCWSYPVVLL
jgi:hypothetical protein